MDIDDLDSEITKLARLHNLPKAEVRKIYNLQWKRIMFFMKQDQRYDIKVRGFGQFNYNPYAEKIVVERKQKKNE